MLSLNNFSLDTINIVLLVVVAINLIYGLIVYTRHREGIANKLFWGVILAVTAWGLSMVAYRGSPSVELSVFFARILYVSATFIPFIFLYFSFSFPKDEYVFSWWQKVYLPIPFFAVLALSFLPSVLIQNVIFQSDAEKVIIFNVFAHISYGIFISSYFAWAYFNLIGRMLKAKGLERKQYEFVILGTLISTALGVTSNLILPLLGIFAVNWFGQASVVVMIVLISYAILRHDLFNISVIATEFLTVFLWAFVFIRILIAQDWYEKLANIFLLLATVILGAFLVRAARREVEARETIEGLAKKLESANTELEATNGRQENLIHFVGHEVKSYLNKSMAAFSVIAEGDYGAVPPAVTALATSALGEVRKGITAVMDLLQASNLKKGTVQYNIVSFDLKELLATITEPLQKEAITKGLTFEVQTVAGVDYTALGDSAQLGEHVIRNLIDNAVKYTQTGGIVIQLERKKNKILLSVKDTGIGITPEDKTRLFTEGGHGKDSIKVNVHSTGYGLFIAKNIVDAQKGRIRAESDGAGKGSTFVLELPAAAKS